MKKIIYTILIVSLTFSTLCGCSDAELKTKAVNLPEEEQVQAICELATLECYYNNVAKSVKKKGKGIKHLLENDREFWIEYEGIAKIGIDMKKVTMDIKDNVVTVSMPSAELISAKINEETLTENSYVISNDGLLNKNKITAEDQKAAVNDAQATMIEEVQENKALFERAEKEAKKLIENYIKKIGETSNIEYQIKWVHEEPAK